MSETASLRHECGLFGIVGDPDAARLCYLGLHALQHRGQEGAGIVSRDDAAAASGAASLTVRKGQGLVHQVFDEPTLRALPGDTAIGHVRYGTAGESGPANVQPFLVGWREGQLALAHNGTLTNADVLRAELEERGAVFTSTSDSEIILHLVAGSDQRTLVNRLVDGLRRVEGAFCLLLLTPNRLIAVRDPWGFRPLVLGRKGDAWIVASETCAIELLRGEVAREIEPGEMVIIENGELESIHPFQRPARKACVFELIYFGRSDSVIFGTEVQPARVRMGEILARAYPVRGADVVIPVPDSGNAAAMGFSRKSGVPYAEGLLHSHSVGRTFIEPTQRIRDFGVRMKLSPVRSVVEGKRVVVVDDSIVRGTTSQKIVRMLREAGALEVHLRISSPPMTGPCHYGIDTPDAAELIAARNDLPRIRAFLGVDSLAYLSVQELREAVGTEGGFCDACFTGAYPLRVQRRHDTSQVPLFQSRDGQLR
jgi:amidophosphoribosyltransferase